MEWEILTYTGYRYDLFIYRSFNIGLKIFHNNFLSATGDLDKKGSYQTQF